MNEFFLIVWIEYNYLIDIFLRNFINYLLIRIKYFFYVNDLEI